ncbi:glutamate--cysteine ligase GCS2 [Beutenbergia cavernae DSM 12333]|uniref:Putative glutamate--cysteine ligase 2 n=1 Tax=Beutenbergia cavernae (strain ATCC BAA-8 / DSM 12333 / CCUG 43141 / JCM 11478 / NBRC 16432 / NCIMB 13614 / HKI 0122) TaxID=471853 RepID=C5BVU5_BEUC1|nr:glutamate--cysteine ligase [Beutenbergia cavernae]ACQ78535.1 glutamate--cysteine ligase GCS2 [Beutenbergia cavernae DSM 12333]
MRTVGVEEEYILAGPDGRPVARAAAVLTNDAVATFAHPEAAPGDLDEEFFQQQIEIGTPICSTLAEVSDALRACRARADAAAAHVRAGIVALGTSPFESETRTTRGERYEQIAELLEQPARESPMSGCHVHVGIADDDEGVAVIDRIQRWLPVLLAMSANSPFWNGEDTGYSSYRSQVWYRWPSAGPVAPFGSAAAYHEAVAALLRTGAILDPGMVYFDARLSHRYPTVEVRVADVCLDVNDAVLLAVLVRALVETTAREARDGVPAPAGRAELLRLAAWRAARTGLTERIVSPVSGTPEPAHDVVQELFAYLGRALADSGDLATATTLWHRLRERGTGSEQQRRWYAESGDFGDVVARARERTMA